MMLTSSDQQHDLQRCRELGVESYLVKPVSASTLFDSLLTAFGRRVAAQPIAASQCTASENPLHILVADDHAANRELASAILRKRGHKIDFAANGQEAFDAIQRGDFDIVLTDVQMPDMDGFQATAAVREAGAKTQDHVPIIALTAHAEGRSREMSGCRHGRLFTKAHQRS